MDFGEEPDSGGGSDRQKRKTRYHRHTPRQIQQLEAYIFCRFSISNFPFLFFCYFDNLNQINFFGGFL